MKYSCVQLTDLADEILMIIFNQLHNVEALYSLIGVNKRLNKILHDPTFTCVLTLMDYSVDGSISSLPYPMFHRFCSQILPQIHHKIQWLHLELLTMDAILLSANYPNLYGLGLYGLKMRKVTYLFTDESSIYRFKNQISSLIIDIAESDEANSLEIIRFIFTHLCAMFTNLRYLNFGPSLSKCQQLSLGTSSLAVVSSTISELHICVPCFMDCLYLLDGRFNQLHTLYVYITFIYVPQETINNKEKLPNLRSFSLYCETDTDLYDDLVVPLLHRMSNLEKLHLHLNVIDRQTFIEGDDLKRNIINHLSRLHSFTFNIKSFASLYNQTDLSSKDDIQQSFKDFKYNQIISCVDDFPTSRYNQCHVYSYPYEWKCYIKITNNFLGGLFKCVHEVSLFDERPFEHEFFLQIAQSFPFMKKLTITNRKAQVNKQRRKTKNEDEHLSIINYNHLTELRFFQAHEDYLEEFLLNTKTCLLNNVYLFVGRELLEKVTDNFTRDALRLNCSKIIYCYSEYITQLEKDVKDYFFHTDIRSWFT
ncbi:unnamed protein product [Rotaria socialis]|uniref:F-box domain-containing protein n=1 Tax=Rotaria socialis TaxID=392032 RepID=A0A821HQY9_9BILA|nr:unnamed protein product [Rotaria socialis]CAF4689211.1 unnamed protein product [Rotaria socialis]